MRSETLSALWSKEVQQSWKESGWAHPHDFELPWSVDGCKKPYEMAEQERKQRLEVERQEMDRQLILERNAYLGLEEWELEQLVEEFERKMREPLILE